MKQNGGHRLFPLPLIFKIKVRARAEMPELSSDGQNHLHVLSMSINKTVKGTLKELALSIATNQQIQTGFWKCNVDFYWWTFLRASQ